MEPRRVISLVGLRGAGKTTIGRALADRLGWSFLDLDQELERRERRTIPALFAEVGEAGFRAREAALLQALLPGLDRAVVATGGGAVLDARSRTALAATRGVYLRVSPGTAATRVRGDATSRPALAPGGPEAEAQTLLALREPLYRDVAAAEFDGEAAPEALVTEILNALRLV